ncbi:MAG: pyruvate formate lyase family protein [Eubacteriales bacterium]|nr:pyruvate formate lyase family protein [Eubacteriales bacterium]
MNFSSEIEAKIFERTDALRTAYHKTDVFKKWLGYHRVRRQKLSFMRSYANNPHNAYTTRLRRAYAEADILLEMQPVINDHELIVGLPDHTPLTAQEQAEYDELEKVMRAASDTTGLTRGHMALDYEKLIKVGVNGLIKEVTERRAALDINEPENLPKDEFYEGCLVELNALNDLAKRYGAYAADLAEKTEDPKRAEELRAIAENFKVVPMEPAQTFWQGLQCIHFFNFNLWELYYFGRVDRFLEPLYTADIKAGRLTYEKAVELYACFMLLPEAYLLPNVACDAMLGGRDHEGNQVENEVTYVCLDAIRFAHSANGKVTLAINKDTSEKLLRRAIQTNAAGLTQPALFNDDLIIDSFVHYGVPAEIARDYCNTGCAEVTPCGHSGCYVVAPYHNLVDRLLETMRTSPEGETEAEFLARFEKDTRKAIFDANLVLNRRQMERSRIGCDVLRASCLVHDCLETGKSIDEGGAFLNLTEPNFVGFGSTVDSIRALRELVFSGEYTMKEMLEILESDFKDKEVLRQRLINKVPHFGTNEESTDAIADELSKMLVRCCKGISNFRRKDALLPGVFSYVEHSRYGAKTIASPDGRHAGYPLSSGSSPVQGKETKGPTAALLSNTSWSHFDYLGGVAINLKFSQGQMSDENEDKMLDFIHVFLERGGYQMQLNCVDRETLLEAQKHPEQYSDLLVRVGGFAAYFCKLPKLMQQEIIDRDAHDFQ